MLDRDPDAVERDSPWAELRLPSGNSPIVDSVLNLPEGKSPSVDDDTSFSSVWIVGIEVFKASGLVVERAREAGWSPLFSETADPGPLGKDPSPSASHRSVSAF